MLKLFATHHNKIQFFGYEVANIVWAIHQTWGDGAIGYGLNIETCAALAFLAGSASIWRFHPQKRPQMLFYGGLLLTLGGLFLTAAGFALTGLAVAVASLETARGGLGALQAYVAASRLAAGRAPASHRFTLALAQRLIGWYVWLVARVADHFPRFGCFINERPFVTGTLIKAPLRVEFITKKLLVGDWVSAAVGCSWMLLGDVALAFNDRQLQRFVEKRLQHGTPSIAVPGD